MRSVGPIFRKNPSTCSSRTMPLGEHVTSRFLNLITAASISDTVFRFRVRNQIRLVYCGVPGDRLSAYNAEVIVFPIVNHPRKEFHFRGLSAILSFAAAFPKNATPLFQGSKTILAVPETI